MSNMALSAHHVATVIRARQPSIGTKKLHKLLYYCQGHHLAHFGEPLFTESISAWDMGPVVGELWFAEKHRPPPPETVELSEGELNTVGYVLSRYGALTGQDLENLTHSEAPWKLADSSREPGQSVRIKAEWLTEYFRTAGAASDDSEIPLPRDAVREWLSDADARRKEAAQRDDIDALRAWMRSHG